jgi:hypothetical protein
MTIPEWNAAGGWDFTGSNPDVLIDVLAVFDCALNHEQILMVMDILDRGLLKEGKHYSSWLEFCMRYDIYYTE